MSAHYELRTPTRWAQPPSVFSFSSLQTLGLCSRRWQLENSEWGGQARFPSRVHPSAVEGQIVHDGLDRLARALGLAGRPPIGSPEFQAVAEDCGFWKFFGDEVAARNKQSSEHPRTGPGFVIRTPPRELANRAVMLFRQQYQAGTGKSLSRRADSLMEVETPIFDRLLRAQSLSEVRLTHPDLPLVGILDVVMVDDEGHVSIVDFKTGAPKEGHLQQLYLYAVLWWRATGRPPARIEVQYLTEGLGKTVTVDELERAERKCASQICDASAAILMQPAPATTGGHCRSCAVRARCDDGWRVVESAAPVVGLPFDTEVRVDSVPATTGFMGLRCNGAEVAVVYDAAVGSTLPEVSVGARVRLIGVLPRDECRTLEFKAWSECFVV